MKLIYVMVAALFVSVNAGVNFEESRVTGEKTLFMTSSWVVAPQNIKGIPATMSLYAHSDMDSGGVLLSFNLIGVCSHDWGNEILFSIDGEVFKLRDDEDYSSCETDVIAGKNRTSRSFYTDIDFLKKLTNAKSAIVKWGIYESDIDMEEDKSPSRRKMAIPVFRQFIEEMQAKGMI